MLIYQVLALRPRQRISIRDPYKELVLFNHLLHFNNERSLIQKVFSPFYSGEFKIGSFLHFISLLFCLPTLVLYSFESSKPLSILNYQNGNIKYKFKNPIINNICQCI